MLDTRNRSWLHPKKTPGRMIALSRDICIIVIVTALSLGQRSFRGDSRKLAFTELVIFGLKSGWIDLLFVQRVLWIPHFGGFCFGSPGSPEINDRAARVETASALRLLRPDPPAGGGLKFKLCKVAILNSQRRTRAR